MGDSEAVRTLRMGSAFTIDFQTPILEKLATVGKYDGKTPALTVGTVGGRLMLHVPAGKDQGGSGEIKALNIQKTVTALTAGCLAKKKGVDQVIIGTQTSVSAYDVERNSDSFFKDAEGVSALCVGEIEADTPWVIAGSNCSVNGYDEEGKDQYWTVTSDNISALALVPWQNISKKNSLLVGTEDAEIRVYDGERAVSTMVESDKATQLVATGAQGRFAYSLNNGTVGVYLHDQRQWKFKSKHKVTSIAVCDVNFDGVPEVVVGWDNGKFEIRGDGVVGKEVMYKDILSSPVSAVLSADYRGDGRPLPIICAYDGNVSGYLAMEQTSTEEIEAHSQRILAKQMETRQSLQAELSSLEQQVEMQRKGETDAKLPSQDAVVNTTVRPNSSSNCVEVVVTATEGAQVRCVIVNAPTVFGNAESNFYYPDEPSDTMVLPVRPEKDVEAELHLCVLIGAPMADVFQVHDLTLKMPRFAMLVPCKDYGGEPDPEGSVVVHIGDNLGRVSQWLQTSFSGFIKCDGSRGANIQARYFSLRDGARVTITATPSNNGEFQIKTDRMDLAGDLIQHMCQFMGITDLQCTANFPVEFEKFKDVLSKVDEYNTVRMKLTAEMADSTQLVKALVIKAEDARILGDIRLMRKMYANLYDVNKELLGEYMKRANNHNELLAALKEVHSMIEKASNLRMGKPKSSVVSECRQAIKNQNKLAIFNVIRTGSA